MRPLSGLTAAVALIMGAAAAMSACAASRKVDKPLRFEANQVTGEAWGAGRNTPDPVPSTPAKNRGAKRLVVTHVSAVWDTRSGRGRGTIAGAFLVGSDADLTRGEGGAWPPPEFSKRQRRWVPGGGLASREDGQVWVGVTPPRHRVSHLVGFRVSYRVGSRRLTAEAPVDYWYCYGMNERQCDAEIAAAQS